MNAFLRNIKTRLAQSSGLSRQGIIHAAVPLLLIFVLSVGIKYHFSADNLHLDPEDDTCLYFSESATQYYHAHRIAQGESIPARDIALAPSINLLPNQAWPLNLPSSP